ncbi:MAG: outer membrane beta-barrel protein [Bacteroidetes bacterium]|nr:outer membrane beta-barrel protein [Bacteroidota bacterium]
MKIMKSFAILFISLFFGVNAYAQISKGSKLIGGSLNFYSSDNIQGHALEKSSSNSQNFNSQVFGGYFIKDNLAIGLGAGYGLQKSSNEANNHTSVNTSNRISFMPFTRYYKMVNDNFGIFAQAQLGFIAGSSKSQQDSPGVHNLNPQSKFTTLNLTVSPGVCYFLTNKFSLEGSFGGIGYNTTNTKTSGEFNSKSTSTSNDVFFNFNFSGIGLGLVYYWGR